MGITVRLIVNGLHPKSRELIRDREERQWKVNGNPAF